tara:strand:+ start:6460 stop:6720 length:261 start_codon:yes stop_codon:yes gene_type:complete
MNEGKRREERDRGARAQAILKDPLVVEALETLEQQYIDAWKTSPNRDEEGRERIYLLMKSLEVFKGHLISVVETGKLADRELSKKF